MPRKTSARAHERQLRRARLRKDETLAAARLSSACHRRHRLFLLSGPGNIERFCTQRGIVTRRLMTDFVNARRHPRSRLWPVVASSRCMSSRRFAWTASNRGGPATNWIGPRRRFRARYRARWRVESFRAPWNSGSLRHRGERGFDRRGCVRQRCAPRGNCARRLLHAVRRRRALEPQPNGICRE